MNKYQSPKYLETGFNCPHCNAYSQQQWTDLVVDVAEFEDYAKVDGYQVAQCYRCHEISLWRYQNLVFPADGLGVQEPNKDLDTNIKDDYLEAASILQKSPRGAVALLRLCVQKVCQQLGEKGENINHDIKSLVAKGLKPQIQQALDIVRVVGNNAVHPGQIDLKDDLETANKLFSLINFIAQTMITEPKEIGAMFNGLPQSQLDAIAKRDGMGS